jgi:hypothetical protein
MELLGQKEMRVPLVPQEQKVPLRAIRQILR